MRVPPSCGSKVNRIRIVGILGSGLPSAPRNPSFTSNALRLVDGLELPEAARLLAVRAGHVVLGAAADLEVVPRERGRPLRRAPEALELTRISVRGPHAGDGRGELGDDLSSSALWGPCESRRPACGSPWDEVASSSSRRATRACQRCSNCASRRLARRTASGLPATRCARPSFRLVTS